jgi:hypothetical protein
VIYKKRGLFFAIYKKIYFPFYALQGVGSNEAEALAKIGFIIARREQAGNKKALIVCGCV